MSAHLLCLVSDLERGRKRWQAVPSSPEHKFHRFMTGYGSENMNVIATNLSVLRGNGRVQFGEIWSHWRNTALIIHMFFHRLLIFGMVRTRFR